MAARAIQSNTIVIAFNDTHYQLQDIYNSPSENFVINHIGSGLEVCRIYKDGIINWLIVPGNGNTATVEPFGNLTLVTLPDV